MSPHTIAWRIPPSRSVVAGFGLAWAAIVGGCGAPQEDGLAAVYDLVEGLAGAELRQETRAIDFDDPEARLHLRTGWSYVEHHPRHRERFAWGTAPASELAVWVLEPEEERTLRFRGHPLAGLAAPQVVSIAVDDRPVGEVTLAPGLRTYSLRLPPHTFRAGDNRLRLRYSQAGPPMTGGGRGGRRLAVAWYDFGLAGDGGEPPRLSDDRREILLPPGSAAVYYLALPPRAELRVAGVTTEDGAAATTEVSWSTDGGREGRFELASGGRHRLPSAGELTRLAMRPPPRGDGDPGGALQLARPTIFGRRATGGNANRPAARPPAVAERPNLLIYLVDTLRADHLGCYGGPPGVSPVIDRFAASAMLFERAYAQSSWTRSSVASIFTGLWPPEHGANRRTDSLAPERTTLAELLRSRGYATAAVVTNVNVTASFGFDQGFDDFVYLRDGAAEAVTAEAVAWLDRRSDPEVPFFLYLHTIEPHAPYAPPAPFRQAHAASVPDELWAGSLKALEDLAAGHRPVEPGVLTQLTDLYRAEVAANDAAFGDVLEALRRRRLSDRTAVLFVSDHGEEFHEHGHFQHGRALFVESLQVPLILKIPAGARGQRIRDPVQHVDILPTLLELAGLPVPGSLEGRSLLRPREARERDAVFSYLHLDGTPRASVTTSRWKLIHEVSGSTLGSRRFFDLLKDPEEQRDVAGDHPVLAGHLASPLRRRLRAAVGSPLAPQVELTDELRRELEALGYI